VSLVSGGVEVMGGRRASYPIAKYEEAVYILHAFQKKTQKTPKRDLTIGQQR
jgi:phage-related protein